MPPRLTTNTDHTHTYPDIEKLKEKYSPQKKIPPPQRGPSESFAKKYKVFATAPRRNFTVPTKNANGTDMRGIHMNILEPPSIGSRSGSPVRSDDSISSGSSMRPFSSGGLSPIRRSGSPIRRRNISEIEQERSDGYFKRGKESTKRQYIDNRNSGTPILEVAPPMKKQKVSFNQEVEFNDTFTTSSLNDENGPNASSIPSTDVRSDVEKRDEVAAENKPMNDGDFKSLAINLNRFMEVCNRRLESLEDNQQELLDVVRTVAPDPSLTERLNKLQDKIRKYRNI